MTREASFGSATTTSALGRQFVQLGTVHSCMHPPGTVFVPYSPQVCASFALLLLDCVYRGDIDAAWACALSIVFSALLCSHSAKGRLSPYGFSC